MCGYPSGVSARMAEGLPVAGALYVDWGYTVSGARFRMPVLHGPAVARERSGGSAAAFFSGGVDSMFTVAHNLRRYPRTDSRAIKGLVLVHGLDISLASSDRFGHTAVVLGETARAIDLPLIAPATNVRALLPGLNWFTLGHGPCLALVALALSGRFQYDVRPVHEFLHAVGPVRNAPGTRPALVDRIHRVRSRRGGIRPRPENHEIGFPACLGRGPAGVLEECRRGLQLRSL